MKDGSGIMEEFERELIVSSLNSEMNRFWTRFNVFAGVQVGGLLGVVHAARILLANIMMFRFVLVVLVLFSTVGSIAIFRGHDLQRALVKTLAEAEGSLAKEKRLFGRVVGNMRMPLYTCNIACCAFGVICVLLWVAGWVWLEKTGFAICVPK